MTNGFTQLTAVAMPLLRDNINTDAIIPSREIKSVAKTGLAGGLFADWRYTHVGGRELEKSFILNQPQFVAAQILLAGMNFGCGSSREHAAWALREYGFRAIIAEDFNAIFRNNAVLNGIVPVVLPRAVIASIAARVRPDPDARVTIDLDQMVVIAPGGEAHTFTIDQDAQAMLREGLDTIDLTLRHSAAISKFRQLDKAIRPWIYCV